MSSIPYLPGAQPYYYPGSKTGVLILHGLTASPAEPRWLGEHLAAVGLSVCGVRLAGHGTDYRALARVGWQDWAASAIDGYSLLKTTCERIVVVGHSMGGTLALAVAAESSLKIDALSILAAPVEFTGRRMEYLHLIKHFLPYSDQTDRTSFPDVLRAEQARRGEPAVGRIRYDRWATHGVAELLSLTRYAAERLAQIKIPIQLIYSTQDQVIPIRNMALIQERIGSDVVETVTLEKSGHILPQDIERDAVFQHVEAFIRKQIGSERP